MLLSKEIIRCRIIDIINDKLNYPRELLTKENWDEPLTGVKLGFSAVDLTYLFLEVEKAFNVQISEKLLRGYGFSTINKVTEVVCCSCQS